MRFLVTAAIALLLLCLESVVVRQFSMPLTRIDVTVVLLVFLALRANLLEGAFSAHVVGYLLDVMSGRPTGMYTFLAVVLFLAVRVVGALVDARSLFLFSVFTVGASLTHGVLAVLLSSVSSQTGSAWAGLSGLPTQAFLSLLFAIGLWPVLLKVDPGRDRPEAGVLR